MSIYFPKQSGSRPVLNSTSTTTAIKAGSETFQLRVVNISTAVASITIADSSAGGGSTGITISISGGAAGSAAEYFAITPGQWYTLSPNVTATEMT